MIVERMDGLVCDLDGVVYRGDQPIAGASEAIDRMRRTGLRLVFCTNNSRLTVDEYVQKLAGLGVKASPAEVLTSGVVTAEVLAERGVTGAHAIVVGGQGLRAALTDVGIVIDDDPSAGSADLVVVGWDRAFDFDAMRRAALAVRSGADFVATNKDASFPAPGGELWPGAGAILASIEVASGRSAEVMGKPHAPMMDAAARRLSGCEHIAIVGDRPETDLAGGVVRGWTTILVLSGVTDASEVESLDPPADLVIDSLANLAP